jgi:hypothetical protein
VTDSESVSELIEEGNAFEADACTPVPVHKHMGHSIWFKTLNSRLNVCVMARTAGPDTTDH